MPVLASSISRYFLLRFNQFLTILNSCRHFLAVHIRYCPFLLVPFSATSQIPAVLGSRILASSIPRYFSPAPICSWKFLAVYTRPCQLLLVPFPVTSRQFCQFSTVPRSSWQFMLGLVRSCQLHLPLLLPNSNPRSSVPTSSCQFSAVPQFLAAPFPSTFHQVQQVAASSQQFLAVLRCLH